MYHSLNDTNTLFCFESVGDLEAFCWVYPEHAEKTLTFEDIVEPLFGKKIQAKSSSEETFKMLIESHLTDPNDIEAAFLFLPQTPKNKTLKKNYLAFLQTEESWTSHRKAIEVMKDLKTKEEPSNILFFRKMLGSAVFVDFAEKLNAKCIYGWELDPIENPGERTAIFFSGKPHEKTLVELNIQHQRMPNTRLFEGCYFSSSEVCVSHAILGEDAHTSNLEKYSLEISELETLKENGFEVPTLSQEKREKEKLLTLSKSPLDYIQINQVKAPQDNWDQVTFKPSTFSASQLEKFHSCPARYYFSRLRLSPPKEKITDPAFMGQAIHRALEWYFKSKGDLKAFYKDALLEGQPTLAQDAVLSSSYEEIFSRFLPAIDFIENKLNEVFGKRTVYALEQKIELDIAPEKTLGIIDRIDETADGKLILLDYKTGEIDFTPKHIQSGDNFQAWLYLKSAIALLKKPIVGFLFYDLKKAEIKRGIVFEDQVSKDQKKHFTRGHVITYKSWEELDAAATAIFAGYIGEIHRKQFFPRPKISECDRCDTSAVCGSSLAYE